jgi:hypothetical protein
MMRRALACAVVGACLAGGPLTAQQEEHHHPADVEHAHSHQGPGPHFIDAFFTENAYIERKIRPDVGFAAGPEGNRWLAEVEVEWALAAPFSLIAHAPFQQLRPEGGDTETGIGDVTLGAKYALVNDRSRFILAVGGDVDLPTGDETRGLGEGHAALAPFVLAWVPFGPERRFLFQTGVHIDIPLAGEEGEHAQIGGVLSWTSPLGVSPIVEGIVEVPFDGGAASWFVAPEARWEFLDGWEAGAALRVPVGGPESDEEDWRLVVGLIRHFALPGGGGH